MQVLLTGKNKHRVAKKRECRKVWNDTLTQLMRKHTQKQKKVKTKQKNKQNNTV